MDSRNFSRLSRCVFAWGQHLTVWKCKIMFAYGVLITVLTEDGFDILLCNLFWYFHNYVCDVIGIFSASTPTPRPNSFNYIQVSSKYLANNRLMYPTADGTHPLGYPGSATGRVNYVLRFTYIIAIYCAMGKQIEVIQQNLLCLEQKNPLKPVRTFVTMVNFCRVQVIHFYNILLRR